MDEADLDALYRVADQPWTVGVERSARARRWLPRIARAFVERHGPGAREAVRSALARTAEALLRARAPSRRVFLARWMLAFRISPGVACSPGLAVRGLVRLLSGKAV